MRIEKQDKYVILGDERDDVKAFAAYLERIVPQRYEHDNLVVDLMKYENLSLEDLLAFLKLSNYHRSSKHSFVLVNNVIDIDDVPLEMILVPTLVEAGDIVEMEEIERDLGF